MMKLTWDLWTEMRRLRCLIMKTINQRPTSCSTSSLLLFLGVVAAADDLGLRPRFGGGGSRASLRSNWWMWRRSMMLTSGSHVEYLCAQPFHLTRYSSFPPFFSRFFMMNSAA